MSQLSLWAIGSDLPVKVLAVVGAFTLGGFFGGWLVSLVTKVWFRRTLPPWLAWGIRLLFGVLFALLTYLWLFGTGGGGWWPFNTSGGNGKDKGGVTDKADKDGKKPDPVEKPKDKEPEDNGKTNGTGVGTVDPLHIEVLGDAPLKRLAGDNAVNLEKRYRVKGGPNTLRTLEEVKTLILNRRTQSSPLKKLNIIIYLDSPARDKTSVKALIDWASDLGSTGDKLLVEYTEPDQAAPLK